MWFWEKESVEYEVFKKYERALVTIAVNFADAEVTDALEGCSYDLSVRYHYHPRKLPPQLVAPYIQMYREMVDIINAA